MGIRTGTIAAISAATGTTTAATAIRNTANSPGLGTPRADGTIPGHQGLMYAKPSACASASEITPAGTTLTNGASELTGICFSSSALRHAWNSTPAFAVAAIAETISLLP